MICTILGIIISSVLLIYSFYCQFRKNIRIFNKIPGPKGWPLIGNIFDIVVSNEAILQKIKLWQTQYGNIVRYWLMHVPNLIINHPDYAEKILSSKKFNEKPATYGFIRPWLCEGLFLSNGDKWHHRRKMLTPAFHFDILKQFMKTFVDQTNLLVARLQQEVGKELTDPAKIIAPTILKIICETAMGTNTDNEDNEKVNEYIKSVHTFGECIVYRVKRVILYFEWVYFFTFNRIKRDEIANTLKKYSEEIINQRRDYRHKLGFENSQANSGEVYGKKRMAMLDLLLLNEKKGQIDKMGVREEVDTFIFVGHDTISTAISFFLLCIANEQEIQNRIYEELKRIFEDDDRDPTIQDLTEMKYLECCIKESLRLYPSVPLIMRHINEEVQLGPYTVLAGTMCIINIFGIHHQPDLYPEPQRFIPERFLPENMKNRHQYAFLPFSAGPRNCIGKKFAMMEMKTLLSGILRKFKLEPVTKHEELVFTLNLLLKTTKPFYVRITNRVCTS